MAMCYQKLGILEECSICLEACIEHLDSEYLKNYFNNKDVVVLGQTYVTHQPKVDISAVQEIVSTANANAQIIDTWLTPEQGLSRKDAILYNYVNQMTKAGKLDQLRTGFFDWLKTSKVSGGQQTKLMAGDTKGLDAIMDLVVKIQTCLLYTSPSPRDRG